MLQYNTGCINTLGKMPDEALNCLQRSIKTGLAQEALYENDSNIDILRELPHFKQMLNSI